jgi:hypothetical protein
MHTSVRHRAFSYFKNMFILIFSATTQMQPETGSHQPREPSHAISAKRTQIGRPSGSLAPQPLKSGK